MFQIRPANWRLHLRLVAGILVLLLACPVWSYDFRLTSSAIRDAYFLGTRQAGMGDDFLAQYTHFVPPLRLGDNLVTRIRIETPFLQVAAHASKTNNYNAQDAVKDFYGKPAGFRMYLEIRYMVDAPLPSAVKVAVLQDDKEILPQSGERTAFFPATGPYTPAVDVGEIVTLEFDPRKLDSSTLIVRIDTPDDQHVKTEFDLQALR